MSMHQKVGGSWQELGRPYVKRDGVWTPVAQVLVKDAGAWKPVFTYDATPPPAPLLSVTLVESGLTGRHLMIGVRSPDSVHDAGLRRIRVLSTYNGAAPTTQYGGTFTSTPDRLALDEPWSDFYYNGYQGAKGGLSTQARIKTWPPSATSNTELPGGQTYYFTAWAEDDSGNWSTATPVSIYVPKRAVEGQQVVSKEYRFSATMSGTAHYNMGFVPGELIQQVSPQREGLWFYNGEIQAQIGSQGTPTIRKAQIYVPRMDDNGGSVANIYLHWHEYNNVGQMPGVNAIGRQNTTFMGQLSKGQASWIDLPDAFLEAMQNRQVAGFGLAYRDPSTAGTSPADYSVVSGVSQNARSGELYVSWVETV